jgi:hypothetical protein
MKTAYMNEWLNGKEMEGPWMLDVGVGGNWMI